MKKKQEKIGGIGEQETAWLKEKKLEVLAKMVETTKESGLFKKKLHLLHFPPTSFPLDQPHPLTNGLNFIRDSACCQFACGPYTMAPHPG